MVVERKIGRVRYVSHAPITSGLWADVTVDQAFDDIEPLNDSYPRSRRFTQRIYF